MKVIRVLTLCLVAFLITMSTVHAQVSFIVNSPKAGDILKIGETKNIEWSYSSPQTVSQNWKLVLIKGSTVVGTIVNNVSGSSYRWVVGQYLGGVATPGADYKIQISHVTSTRIKNNSGVFSILFGSIATKIGPEIGSSKPSMTAKQKPELVKTQPKMELRKPNLRVSVEAFYDSYCTQKIPLASDTSNLGYLPADLIYVYQEYHYLSAPSPKFIYFLIKIKNLVNPVYDIGWHYEYYHDFIDQFGQWFNYSADGKFRNFHLWGLAANEEFRFIQRSDRVEPKHVGEAFSLRVYVSARIDEGTQSDNYAICRVAIR